MAHELRRAFPDGIWLAELAAVHDPAQVPRAVAVALGLLETSAREPGGSVFVWAGGVKAPGLVADSGLPASHNGRVKVDRYLRVLDRPEVYVAGDLAWPTCSRTPSSGSTASPSGTCAVGTQPAVT